ncbi:MAG: ASCH domain-containing protein [Carnobacterium sp.]|uniref:ASCH domain-containing protein n=1 Tax=Carnobacterium sp. TMP28 TaxID=3397060 RepID=UPI001E0D5798|nr:ASCH domain-containing protein [Carnobacterium sp.]
MINESAEELWENFKLQNSTLPNHYDLMTFGDTKDRANHSAALILEGLKTAKTTLLLEYQRKEKSVPQEGSYSMILDGNNQAIGIVQLLKVSILPFDQVSAELAYEEGEGDRTLTGWQELYQDYFEKQCKEEHWHFSPKIEVVCIQFEFVYAA